jgi:hypothetical protein
VRGKRMKQTIYSNCRFEPVARARRCLELYVKQEANIPIPQQQRQPRPPPHWAVERQRTWRREVFERIMQRPASVFVSRYFCSYYQICCPWQRRCRCHLPLPSLLRCFNFSPQHGYWTERQRWMPNERHVSCSKSRRRNVKLCVTSRS